MPNGRGLVTQGEQGMRVLGDRERIRGLSKRHLVVPALTLTLLACGGLLTGSGDIAGSSDGGSVGESGLDRVDTGTDSSLTRDGADGAEASQDAGADRTAH